MQFAEAIGQRQHRVVAVQAVVVLLGVRVRVLDADRQVARDFVLDTGAVVQGRPAEDVRAVDALHVRCPRPCRAFHMLRIGLGLNLSAGSYFFEIAAARLADDLPARDAWVKQGQGRSCDSWPSNRSALLHRSGRSLTVREMRLDRIDLIESRADSSASECISEARN